MEEVLVRSGKGRQRVPQQMPSPICSVTPCFLTTSTADCAVCSAISQHGMHFGCDPRPVDCADCSTDDACKSLAPLQLPLWQHHQHGCHQQQHVDTKLHPEAKEQCRCQWHGLAWTQAASLLLTLRVLCQHPLPDRMIL